MSKSDKEKVYNLDKYSDKGPTLGDIHKLSKKDPSKLTKKEKEQLAKFNKQVKEAFKTVDFDQIFNFQKALADSLLPLANMSKAVFNFQYNSYAIIQQVSKFGLQIKSVNESLSITLNALQGRTVINNTASIETAVKSVRAKDNDKIAIGGKIISYQKRGDFCWVKHSDFELLVNQASTNNSIKDDVAEIKKMLEDKTNSKPIQVKAKFSKFTAELSLFGVTISVSSGSFQASLCEVLFNDSESLGDRWHIDDLLETEEFGIKEVMKDERKDWIERVYQWARQLNQKIAEETGNKDFILVRKQEIFINPKYLD